MTRLCVLASLFVGLLLVGEPSPIRADETASQPASEIAPVDATVAKFLAEYCVHCHGGDEPSGDRAFEELAPAIYNDDSLIDYQDILDQLNLSEMPPSDEMQPSDAERQQVIDLLTKSVSTYHQLRRGSSAQAVLRRLNAREYRQTIGDLLQIDMTMFDPTESFPRDQTTEHLDNVGETLVTSGYLLARYLEAAEQVIDKALLPRERPPVRTWTFRDGFRQQPEIDQVHRKTNHFEHMTLYDVVGADKPEGAYGPILAFREGVPFDGTYELRIKAEAVNRLHPYDPDFLGTDPSEPLRLGIVAGNVRAGLLHKQQPIEPLLAEIDLADEPKWYTVRVHLDKGFTPRFTFRNGLMDVRNLWAKLLRKYPDQFPERKKKGIVEARFNAIKYGKLPQIHIHEIEIEGPFFESWPTPSQQVLLGEESEQILATGEITPEQTRRHIRRFASRAYRRPVTNEEVDRIVQVVESRQAAGRSSLKAFGDGLKTILCSPNFLYLDQSTDEDGLTPHALASRLSCFLWSSMPDEELLARAADGTLREPEVLAEQVSRMLDDPRSDAFIEGFLASWLTLRDLGSMPPDRGDFRSFYHYDLDTAMRRETFLFTRHLLDENLSVVNFLDADFTFVNRPLARLYDLPAPKHSGFEKVSLPDRRRGGLLGQASVLTVTANGIDTSPVVRGVWLLENILGTPPSPPPPDVEPLDPDIRGAKTIREQLARHRDVPSCNECHRRIDPLGFALENFDPIGGWRETYGRKTKIDAAGELPNGTSFEDITGLKSILVQQREQFVRALTSKLLAYATGRPMHATDRGAIDRVVTELDERGNGFRDLVTLVVQSELFCSR